MRVIAFVFSSSLLFLPSLVDAAVIPTQLVPVACNDPSTCGTCEFVSLINNIIDFVLWFATLAATAMIMYGGFRLLTSGGDSSAKTTARNIITNVIIGYAIVLSAFLIINTLLAALASGGSNSSLLHWNTIECLYPKTPTETAIPDFVDADVSTNLGYSLGVIGGASSDQYFANSTVVCSQTFLEQYFGSAAAQAACIASRESSCGATLFSGSDRDANGQAFSIGAFQINLTVHHVIGCTQFGAASNDLPCSQAYSGSNYSARIINTTLYNACVDALLDPRCSAVNAVRIKNEAGGWRPWSTHTACGV